MQEESEKKEAASKARIYKPFYRVGSGEENKVMFMNRKEHINNLSFG